MSTTGNDDILSSTPKKPAKTKSKKKDRSQQNMDSARNEDMLATADILPISNDQFDDPQSLPPKQDNPADPAAPITDATASIAGIASAATPAPTESIPPTQASATTNSAASTAAAAAAKPVDAAPAIANVGATPTARTARTINRNRSRSFSTSDTSRTSSLPGSRPISPASPNLGTAAAAPSPQTPDMGEEPPGITIATPATPAADPNLQNVAAGNQTKPVSSAFAVPPPPPAAAAPAPATTASRPPIPGPQTSVSADGNAASAAAPTRSASSGAGEVGEQRHETQSAGRTPQPPDTRRPNVSNQQNSWRREDPRRQQGSQTQRFSSDQYPRARRNPQPMSAPASIPRAAATPAPSYYSSFNQRSQTSRPVTQSPRSVFFGYPPHTNGAGSPALGSQARTRINPVDMGSLAAHFSQSTTPYSAHPDGHGSLIVKYKQSNTANSSNPSNNTNINTPSVIIKDDPDKGFTATLQPSSSNRLAGVHLVFKCGCESVQADPAINPLVANGLTKLEDFLEGFRTVYQYNEDNRGKNGFVVTNIQLSETQERFIADNVAKNGPHQKDFQEVWALYNHIKPTPPAPGPDEDNRRGPGYSTHG